MSNNEQETTNVPNEANNSSSPDAEKHKRPPGSRRRQVHNAVERRRKDKINNWISKIGELLPANELQKLSKISILEETVNYIKLLVKEREKLLSENRTEVEVAEIKKLQKDLTIAREQNQVYEKLLEQVHINPNTLPKHPLKYKYSGKFERQNGVLTVKNSENVISTGNNVSTINTVSNELPTGVPTESSPSTVPSKKDAPTTATKMNPIKKKIQPALKKLQKKNSVSVSSKITSVPVPTCKTNNSVINSDTLVKTMSTDKISKESIISNWTASNITKDTFSTHSGGVTTVLSQFPIMSTTQNSSLIDLCNKNMSTIIIPTGGSILQQYSEKPQNTISIICPTTMPIIVPQLINVSRNVGLICPNDSPDKSALLTINPTPGPSNILANTSFILHSQAGLIGNVQGSVNLSQSVASSEVSTMPREDVLIPLSQNPSIAIVNSSSSVNNQPETSQIVPLKQLSPNKMVNSMEGLQEDKDNSDSLQEKGDKSNNNPSLQGKCGIKTTPNLHCVDDSNSLTLPKDRIDSTKASNSFQNKDNKSSSFLSLPGELSNSTVSNLQVNTEKSTMTPCKDKNDLVSVSQPQEKKSPLVCFKKKDNTHQNKFNADKLLLNLHPNCTNVNSQLESKELTFLQSSLVKDRTENLLVLSQVESDKIDCPTSVENENPDKNCFIVAKSKNQLVISTTTAANNDNFQRVNKTVSISKVEISSPAIKSVSSSSTPLSSKVVSLNCEIRNNSLPSLQLLSANKIISLANQSKKDGVGLTFKHIQKELAPQLPNHKKSAEPPNNLKLQLTGEILGTVNSNISASKEIEQDISKKSDIVSKSNFSLTALMGVCDKNKSKLGSETTNDHSEQTLVNMTTSNQLTLTTVNSATDTFKTSTNDMTNDNKTLEPSQCNASMPNLHFNVKLSNLPRLLPHCSANNPVKKVTESSNQKIAPITSTNTSSVTVNRNIPCSSAKPNLIAINSSQMYNSSIKKDQKQCHNFTNSVVALDNVTNVYSETSLPYGIADSTLNQNLPALYSTNQLVAFNSSIFMCPIQENVPNTPLNNCQLINEASLSKVTPNISLNAAFAKNNQENESSCSNSTVTVSQDGLKRSSEIMTNASNSEQTASKCVKTSSSNDILKQSPNTKKKKLASKNFKLATSEMQTLANTLTSVNSNFETNKLNSNETLNSFSKNDEFNQEFNSSIFTTDILARATESIFENDMLDSPHMPKGDMTYYTDNISNISTSITTEHNIENYKLNYTSSTIEPLTSLMLVRQKCMDAKNIYAASPQNNEFQPEIKQIKSCKNKKSKSDSVLEPPLKKLKEIDLSPKSAGKNPVITQSTESDKRPSDVADCVDKQTSAECIVSEVDHSSIETISYFGNQIHIPESNCKTPTSVDSIFSITPMLGDILKDVPHGITLETRNNGFLMCNDNQSFPREKSFLNLNFTTNTNEEFLNLPRMHFPVTSEFSSAPVLPATNVSFAHTMSLCSTQSDTSKTTETLSAADRQTKTDTKKNNICNIRNNVNLLPNNLLVKTSNIKSTDGLPKTSTSEPHFSKVLHVSSSGLLFENQTASIQTSNTSHSITSVLPQVDCHFSTRDSYNAASHTIPFYTPLSTSTNQSFTPSSSSVLPHTTFHTNNSTNLSFPIQTVNASTNTTYHNLSTSLPKVDSLSHSLCSLLKETPNILVENRTVNNSSQNISSSHGNISQSKYSALSLISDHNSYSETPPSSSCHSQFAHSSIVCTPSVSNTQLSTSNSSSCSRNQRSSLSYSAESLIQTSCASTDKNKNKNITTNHFNHRPADKKSERNLPAMHTMNDANIFIPVSTCDISIQNAPLVPLPPVTSFHNFSSNYTLCDTEPSTTIFNSVSRTHDIPLPLSSETYMNHMNLTAESQMLSNRREVSASVPKSHANMTLPFENHSALYNNCNFLPHVKPNLETSRASDSGPCFPATSFSNSYSQSPQKTNCCHFPHRTLPPNSEHPSDISLPVVPPIPPFHHDKTNFQPNRPSLQTNFPQSNPNFVGNLFYSSTNGPRETNIALKPSNIRPSQDSFVSDAPRQNSLDHFNTRKATPSTNRGKSKKGKSLNPSDSNLVMIPNSVPNFQQDSICNKTNLPNNYFKNNNHNVLPPPPSQLSCTQHKISDSTPIPNNPSFNPVLHQQGDNFFNLNFQPSNFAMSPLPRPPTQPLSCTCLTTPIITHTFATSNHPVPNFNLSNILPDMGCSSNQVSSVKFPPVNHATSSQCQTSNSAHIISHQTCAPALYPPHPPIVRPPLNPLLGHNPQSFSDNQVQLVGSGTPSMMPQNATFSATQNPPFRNVIHSLSFPRS